MVIMLTLVSVNFSSCSKDDDGDDGNGSYVGTAKDLIGIWDAYSVAGGVTEQYWEFKANGVMIIYSPSTGPVETTYTYTPNAEPFNLSYQNNKSAALKWVSSSEIVANSVTWKKRK